jgi:hypothetical protein
MSVMLNFRHILTVVILGLCMISKIMTAIDLSSFRFD